jgi:mono/diheme cytochrome c family protein
VTGDRGIYLSEIKQSLIYNRQNWSETRFLAENGFLLGISRNRVRLIEEGKTMTQIIISLIIIIALAVLFGWLMTIAVRAKRGWVRWLGAILSALLMFFFITLAVIGILGVISIYRTINVEVPEVTVDGTPEQVARGEHVAAVLCASCHSKNGELPLSGGKNVSDAAGLPLGDIYAPNLTSATDIKDWSDTDLFRVIRTGVDDEGRATAMTSLPAMQILSDEDILASIAYMRQMEPVEYETPEYKPSILMALLAGMGQMSNNLQETVNPVTAPAKAATAEYGEYIAGYMDCHNCHGQGLDGTSSPPFPKGPDIRKYLSSLSKDEFFSLVQTSAAAAQPGDVMPWKFIARHDEVELDALYQYLQKFTSE